MNSANFFMTWRKNVGFCMVIYLYDHKIADVDDSQSLWNTTSPSVTVKQVNNAELEFTSNYCLIYFTTHHLSCHQTGLADDRLKRTPKLNQGYNWWASTNQAFLLVLHWGVQHWPHGDVTCLLLLTWYQVAEWCQYESEGHEIHKDGMRQSKGKTCTTALQKFQEAQNSASW